MTGLSSVHDHRYRVDRPINARADVFHWTAVAQLRAADNSDTLVATLELFREYRELGLVRRYIAENLSMLGDPDPTVGLYGLPEPIRDKVFVVTHFFDHLGVLVAHKLIPVGPVIGFLGGSVEYYWQPLGPHILAERERRSGEYQEYFEMLVTITQRHSPARVRRKTRRRINRSSRLSRL
jgi:hypothetical protein